MSYPGKCQDRGDNDHAAHGFVPSPVAKHVHWDQVERQCDDDTRAFAEIWGKTFAACPAQHGEHLEDMEDQHSAECGQYETDDHAGENFVLVEHINTVCRYWVGGFGIALSDIK